MRTYYASFETVIGTESIAKYYSKKERDTEINRHNTGQRLGACTITPKEAIKRIKSGEAQRVNF